MHKVEKINPLSPLEQGWGTARWLAHISCSNYLIKSQGPSPLPGCNIELHPQGIVIRDSPRYGLLREAGKDMRNEVEVVRAAVVRETSQKVP
jgi:hypothetical protein